MLARKCCSKRNETSKPPRSIIAGALTCSVQDPHLMSHRKAMWAQSFRFAPSSDPSCCNAKGCMARALEAVPAGSSQTQNLWGPAQGREPSLGSGTPIDEAVMLKFQNLGGNDKQTNKEITRMPKFPQLNWYAAFFALKHRNLHFAMLQCSLISFTCNSDLASCNSRAVMTSASFIQQLQ